MRVRPAREDEHAAVMSILDAAMLVTDADAVGERIPEGVLVAVEGSEAPGTPERLLGALVLDGNEIEAVAVRPRRRGQGVGTALVGAAAERRGRLRAEFDADLRPFYESLGFEIERAGAGRLRGRRD